MRGGCGPLGTGPCSSPGLGPMCMIMVFLRPGSIVTVWSRSRYEGGMNAFFGFGANPPRHHGSPLCGPAVHWSRCVSLPMCMFQHLVVGCLSVWAMWVPRVINCFWQRGVLVFGPHFLHAHTAWDWSRSASLVSRVAATLHPSPVGHLGLRLGRVKVIGLPCLPPSELPRSSSSGDKRI